jgi:hypothetical protein
MAIYNLITLAKTSVDNYDYIQADNSVTTKNQKITLSSLFPSMATTGSSSESLWISTTNKNQLNFKGLKSADTKMTVTTASNNLVLTLVESAVDLSNCDNTTAGFLTSVDFTNSVTGENKVVNGGTGLNTILKGSLLYASSDDVLAATTVPTNGQVLIGNASTGIPVWATLTDGDNVTIAETAGAITINANLSNLAANLDMYDGSSTTYHIDTHSGAGWISGSGLAEGLTVDGDGKVFIGEGAPTAFYDDALNIFGGGIRFGNTADVTVKPNTPSSGVAGKHMSISGGASVGSASAGNITIDGGTAAGTGRGGNVVLTAGRDTSGGDDGTIIMRTYTAGSVVSAITIAAEGQQVSIDTGDLIMSTGNVYMRNSSNPDVIKYQGAPSNTDDGATAVSVGNILTGIVTCTPTADRSKSLDTAANLISGLSLNVDNDAFDFSFINLTTDGQDNVTLTNSGDSGNVTLIGNMVIHAQDAADDAVSIGVGRFRIRRTGSGAVTVYRIG